MVSNQIATPGEKFNQCTTKNRPKTLIERQPDPLESLEEELTQVISQCKSIVKDGNDEERENFAIGSKITLESVAEDMSNILDELKLNLKVFKEKKDSFSDVLPSLEEEFQMQIKQHKNNNVSKSNDSNNKKDTGQNTKSEKRSNSAKKADKTKTKVGNDGNRNKQAETKSASIIRNPKGSSTIKNISARNDIPPKKPSDQKSMNNKAPSSQDRKERQNLVNQTKSPVTNTGDGEIKNTALNSKSVLKRDVVAEKILSSTNPSPKPAPSKCPDRNNVISCIPELLYLVRNKEIADLCKRLIKSKLLEHHQVDLYYGNNYESYKECPDRMKQTLINRIRWSCPSYTSKQGLSEASRKSFWFHIPGVSNMNHPRSYKLTKNGDTEEFIKDFNLTAAMSLLKWVKTNHTTGQCKILSPYGKIPLTVFDFAINECYKFIKKKNHEDIDHDINEAMSREWNDFLEHYYRTVHIGNHFKLTGDVTENDLVRKASFILERLKDHWPYLEMDGLMNLWILKPTNSSQGVGIHMCRTLKYVLDVVKANPNRRYVIQKYVERPLLIYNTKFDIRQWFLISSCVPLTIWIYRQCYLRFSSQTYNLRKLHESIHLTNNSVQSRYKKASTDIILPSYNMWDSSQFKNYLSNVGYPQAFDDIIYPGMKESITAAVLMHQESFDQRRNTFELFGADFIVTEDFKPWLLEINSNPALHASTPITARMCPLVLEDVIRVVIDHQRDGKKNTGGFELLYQQQTVSLCKTGPLQVEGTHLKEDYFSDPPTVSEKNSTKVQTSDKLEPVTCIRELGIGMRNTLENLLTILKQEKLKRLKRRNISIETLLSNTSIQTQTSLVNNKIKT
ncbi:tubulin glycylase 3A isoform X3 [Leptinotarsa decemlineata]|uniref:tubulin glycylase 3A isoform X3 n=1 Tax=Leptinotarsa decemlineata TaxID=7539 RepID=UPI003D307B35